MSNIVETRDNQISFVDWMWEKYGIRLEWTINGERTVTYEVLKAWIVAYERYKEDN